MGETSHLQKRIIEEFLRRVNETRPSRGTLITPNSPEVVEVFTRVANHPEVVLSRREIIKYVIAEPGRRSKEVQALLKLESVERFRASLTSASNKLRNEHEAAEAEADAAGRDLAGALNIPHPTSAATLDAVNYRRRLLGLAERKRTAPESRTDTSRPSRFSTASHIGRMPPPAGR